jgi:hypothetical protein
MSEGDSIAADGLSAARSGSRHFVADLDLAQLLTADMRCLTRAPLTDAVRSPTGEASLACS